MVNGYCEIAEIIADFNLYVVRVDGFSLREK